MARPRPREAPLVEHGFVLPGSRIDRLAGRMGAFNNPARLAQFIKGGPTSGQFRLDGAGRDRGHLLLWITSTRQVLDVTDHPGALPISLRAHVASCALALVSGEVPAIR
ncbi:MAG: hypothetical protein M0014_10035 [Actinomycetota bacterium]|nr:hypothetical protein [Actinomycetota bacterium]